MQTYENITLPSPIASKESSFFSVITITYLIARRHWLFLVRRHLEWTKLGLSWLLLGHIVTWLGLVLVSLDWERGGWSHAATPTWRTFGFWCRWLQYLSHHMRMLTRGGGEGRWSWSDRRGFMTGFLLVLLSNDIFLGRSRGGRLVVDTKRPSGGLDDILSSFKVSHDFLHLSLSWAILQIIKCFN